MRLISFVRPTGEASYGVVVGDGVVDLGVRLGGKFPDLKSLIAANALDQAAAAAKEGSPEFVFSELKLLPVIPNPPQIFCIGLNYHEHVKETGREVTEKPVIFLRLTNSQVAHGEPMLLPPESTSFDYEGEIAVVIGKGGRRIKEADAWDHIIGYSCYNDGSIRDWQRHSTQWIPGKNFFRTGAFGPWMVTADEIAAGQQMSVVTRLNGNEMQRATTDMMIHSIPAQIAYISTFTRLEPGDVIVTGTPGGIGAKRNPPVFMKAGDVVEIEVDAIGVLRNAIEAEKI